MRISLTTVLALSLASLAGCGGAASGCAKLATKAGTSTAGKGVAIGTTTHGLESGGAALGRAGAEAEAIGLSGVRSSDDAMRGLADDAIDARASTASEEGGETAASGNGGDVARDILQEGAEQLLDAPSSPQDSDRDDRRQNQ
jgi:hypothetical protein